MIAALVEFVCADIKKKNYFVNVLERDIHSLNLLVVEKRAHHENSWGKEGAHFRKNKKKSCKDFINQSHKISRITMGSVRRQKIGRNAFTKPLHGNL